MAKLHVITLLIISFLLVIMPLAEAGTLHKEGSGDLNDDGMVDLRDIIEMIKLVLGQGTPNEPDMKTNDMDNDNKITLNDFTSLVSNVIKGNCGDGTAKGKCSFIKPKYCNNNGILEDNCQNCGCLTGNKCDVNGTCETGETVYNGEQGTLKPTNIFADIWGKDSAVGIGDVITVKDPQGVLCGMTTVKTERKYIIHVYGDHPSTTEDEGAISRDTLTILVNEKPRRMVPWPGDKKSMMVEL